RGLVAGEAEDVSGLAGTAVGDLFVLGDVRDALREGTRLATGRDGDELVLGLACVGLAGAAGALCAGGRGRTRARGPDGGQGRAQDRPARRSDGGVDQPLAARGRRLDGA